MQYRICETVLFFILQLHFVFVFYLFYLCLPCETPSEEPMELSVIGNFHHLRPHGGSNSGSFDPKLNAF